MLEVAGLSAKYGSIAALADVTLSVERGQIVSLLGSNGAGKSTLLGCITNSVPCRISGSIKLEGVEENLRMGAYGFDRGRRWRSDLQCVYNLFPQLVERRRQAAATLSGGEQQMVAIGRALMARPRIVLLDEPSLGLAPMLVKEIFNLIHEINHRAVTVLLVEQNARQALRIANWSYVLEKGRVTLSGQAERLMEDPHVVEAYLGEA